MDDAAECCVAYIVTMSIVDVLERVEIHHHDAEWPAVAPNTSSLSLERVLKRLVGETSSEPITGRELLQPSRQALSVLVLSTSVDEQP